jgi:hypothetical protein
MRKTIKHFSTVVLFGLLVFITSCQKEDEGNQEIQQEKSLIQVEQIPFNLVKSEHKLFIKQLNNNNSLDTKFNSKNASQNVEIDTNSVTHIIYEDYTSYTFPVLSDETETVLENVLISEMLNGQTAYLLLSYELDVPLDQIDISNMSQHILSKSVTEIGASKSRY